MITLQTNFRRKICLLVDRYSQNRTYHLQNGLCRPLRCTSHRKTSRFRTSLCLGLCEGSVIVDLSSELKRKCLRNHLWAGLVPGTSPRLQTAHAQRVFLFHLGFTSARYAWRSDKIKLNHREVSKLIPFAEACPRV